MNNNPKHRRPGITCTTSGLVCTSCPSAGLNNWKCLQIYTGVHMHVYVPVSVGMSGVGVGKAIGGKVGGRIAVNCPVTLSPI